MIETDRNGLPIIRGAHSNFMAQKLHNVKVAQSRKGWKMADIEKAIADAKAGIVYDREPKGA